jgi:hypothetical protein
MMRFARFVTMMALLLGITRSAGGAGAHDTGLALADPKLFGVSVQTLAMAPAAIFRVHVDAMSLDRIDVDCGRRPARSSGWSRSPASSVARRSGIDRR